MRLSIAALSVALVLSSTHGSLLPSPIIKIPQLPTDDSNDPIGLNPIPIVAEGLSTISNVLLRIGNAIATNGRDFYDEEGKVVGRLSKLLFDGAELVAKITVGINKAIIVDATILPEGGQELTEKILDSSYEDIDNPLIAQAVAFTDPVTNLLLQIVNAIVLSGGKILDAEGNLVASVAEVLVKGGRLVAKVLTDTNTAVCVSAHELIEGGSTLLRAITAAPREPQEVPAV
ncbi:hypothetical protein DMENIID0001_013760 [Sergentomyia squamirostris]